MDIQRQEVSTKTHRVCKLFRLDVAMPPYVDKSQQLSIDLLCVGIGFAFDAVSGGPEQGIYQWTPNPGTHVN
eukprot:11109495-Karenia_brevis.AAC.1